MKLAPACLNPEANTFSPLCLQLEPPPSTMGS